MPTIDCGWKKGCTDAELKNAYKKLSLVTNIDLNKDGVIVLDLLKKFYWQESHCYRIQENNGYAKEEQEHGNKNQLKSPGKKVIASNLHSDLTNEKVAQS
ncbi:hypothetical protein HanOQP8_Chr09g0312381 [Helianthus annuus]|nr:hypothetical protein HanOQP8_Chr09g0312381 [Helianthus annuus]